MRGFLEGNPKVLKAEDGVLRLTRGGTEINFFPSFAWHWVCLIHVRSRLTLGKPSARSCLLAHKLSMPTNQCCVNNCGFGIKFPSSGDEQETQCVDERKVRRSISMTLFGVVPGPVTPESYVSRGSETSDISISWSSNPQNRGTVAWNNKRHHLFDWRDTKP